MIHEILVVAADVLVVHDLDTAVAIEADDIEWAGHRLFWTMSIFLRTHLANFV